MNKFLNNSSILLVSSKPTHRSGLRKILCDLGANNHFIEVASTFTQAKERLTKAPINLLISDDDIGEEGSPIELLDLHAANNPFSKLRFFILSAGGVSSLFRSEFIMKGGDLIIDKPFTNATFTQAFMAGIQEKGNLTFDEEMAMEVSDALKSNNREKALEIFATMKNPQSRSAYYSKGLISTFDKDYYQAYSNFAMSVEKKADLKSLVNLVSTGTKSKQYHELDRYVEKWIKHFPLYAESIPDITRVVLYNKKFDLLNEMIIDNEEARIPIAAGLIVAASDHLDKGEMDVAKSFALKGIEYAGLKPSILLRGLEILVRAGAKSEAQKIMKGLSQKVPLTENQAFMSSVSNILK